MSARVGIDIGGTFTDVVLAAAGSTGISVTKVPADPGAPQAALLAGIQKILEETGVAPDQLGLVLHSTTLATNAVIESKSVEKLGLIVTRGFRDVLEIARQTVPGGFGAILFWEKPAPLVPLELVAEVTERMRADGTVRQPLDEENVREIAREYREQDIAHVGVSLLHAYANGAHEQRIAEIFAAEHPGCRLSLSSRVYPEFREYERTVITLLNAYLVPVMSRYLEAAEGELRNNGVDAPLLIMQSNGGMASAEQVAEAPVYSVLSGPAAGVVASAYAAQQAEQPNLITLDVGGTSTDIGVVTDGRARMTTDATVGERTVNVPMVDVNAIGAGGGSIAWIGPGSSLKVGPHSAGADPGPACYGHGGMEATVTDANLVLGRIPDTLIGGGMTLDRARAESAIADIGRRIGLDPLATAWGIAEIAAENMCHGIREMTVRRGHDPRDFALFAYGGAGPMYAARIAQLLEISTVIVPRFPGVHAALGLLISDLRQDRVVTCHQASSALNLDQVREAYRDLEQDIHASFDRHRLLEGGVSLNRAADFRYAGQGYEVTVDLPAGDLSEDILQEAVAGFHTAHRLQFGYHYDDADVELVNLRASGIQELPSLHMPPVATGNGAVENARTGTRDVCFDAAGDFRETPIFERSHLFAGDEIDGPAVIEQSDSTTVVHPGQHARIDTFGNITISLAPIRVDAAGLGAASGKDHRS